MVSEYPCCSVLSGLPGDLLSGLGHTCCTCCWRLMHSMGPHSCAPRWANAMWEGGPGPSWPERGHQGARVSPEQLFPPLAGQGRESMNRCPPPLPAHSLPCPPRGSPQPAGLTAPAQAQGAWALPLLYSPSGQQGVGGHPAGQQGMALRWGGHRSWVWSWQALAAQLGSGSGGDSSGFQGSGSTGVTGSAGSRDRASDQPPARRQGTSVLGGR